MDMLNVTSVHSSLMRLPAWKTSLKLQNLFQSIVNQNCCSFSCSFPLYKESNLGWGGGVVFCP